MNNSGFNGIFILMIFLSSVTFSQTYLDKPFLQDFADKYELSSNKLESSLFQVRSDRNDRTNILSSNGLLQPYEKELVSDLLFRYLTDSKIIAFDIYQDQFVYLTDKCVFSNAWAGTFYVEHGLEKPTHFVVGDDFSVLVAANGKLTFSIGEKILWEKNIANFTPVELEYDNSKGRFVILSEDAVYTYSREDEDLVKVYDGNNLTSITINTDKNEIVVGTKDGIFILEGDSFAETPINKKLPHTQITCINEIDGRLWFGSAHGAFVLREDGKYDYYASKRWLVDDEVVDISEGPENSVLVLTKNGLSKINFVKMTLADKADHIQKIQRLRHIRHGFTSRTVLMEEGNLSTSVYYDSDNDGLWTSMYLAGELFRYAATNSEDAKRNAYEAFEAMERLTYITGLDGFPARTYEYDGYEEKGREANISEDQKIWRLTPDKRWRWKSTTSSDESCGHFFVYALFAELAPDKEWRDRAIHQLKIEMDHIIRNDWYLVTWNGEITHWGRWNPDYVNKFSIHTGDRRLNSSLVLAFLQATYHFTGEEYYKTKAYELINEHGYDDNAALLASVIGHVEGENLSDTWNHSDDEMYFLTIPNLVNYAFTDELKERFFDAAKSHWEIERSEKNPLWNYLFQLSGGENIDIEESAWWMREFPLDHIAWDVKNSHRKDLEFLEPNFRRQPLSEVLPRDERPLHLHNNAYTIDGGERGRREYPGYVYLLPYWLGRYTGAISAPVK